MAWRIEIIDVETNTTYDLTARTQKININQKLGAEADDFSLYCFDIQLVHIYDYVYIYKDNTLKYAGIVLNQRDYANGNQKGTELQCVSWSYIFNMRVIAETYINGNPSTIIKNLIGKYASDFTTTNVRTTSATIEQLSFPYVKLLEAIESTTDYLNNWYWYVDQLKDVHLFGNYESDGIDITPSTILTDTISIDYVGDMVANRVWVVGSKQAATNYIEQYFTGDGNQRYFTLAYEPNYVEIYVDGVLKEASLDSNDDGTKDFLYNKTNKVVYIPDNIATPFSGTIKVKYKPTKQVIDYFENATNIKKFGLYEKVIKNKNITDKQSARQYGKAEINRVSKPSKVISFTTRNEFKIGQRCKTVINEGLWNISGYYLVKSVRVTITPDDVVYAVSVEEMV